MVDAAHSPDSIHLVLPAALTIDTVEAYASEILPQLTPTTTHVALDAAGLELITTPGMQLLLSLHKTLQAQGAQLVLHQPGEAVSAAFTHLGCLNLLAEIVDYSPPSHGAVRD